MNRSSARRSIRDVGPIANGSTEPSEGPAAREALTAFDIAAGTLRLKAALKRAVANSDAPEYLIDAIRREIRK